MEHTHLYSTIYNIRINVTASRPAFWTCPYIYIVCVCVYVCVGKYTMYTTTVAGRRPTDRSRVPIIWKFRFLYDFRQRPAAAGRILSAGGNLGAGGRSSPADRQWRCPSRRSTRIHTHVCVQYIRTCVYIEKKCIYMYQKKKKRTHTHRQVTSCVFRVPQNNNCRIFFFFKRYSDHARNILKYM